MYVLKGDCKMYKGIAASDGIGIGSAVIIKEQSLAYTSYTPKSIEQELIRFKQAVSDFTEKTMAMAERIKNQIGQKESEILEGQVLMISDPMVSSEIESSIKVGKCSEEAVSTVCDTFIKMFLGIEDEMMKQRASDIGDIKTRLLKLLLGIEEVDISAVAPGTILIAKDLTPSMTAGIIKENVVGIVTEVGGKTSHSAILARALEIPAVLSVENITSLCKDGDELVIDGFEGTVIDNLTDTIKKEYSDKNEKYMKYKKELSTYIGKKTVTADGIEVELFGNIGKPEDAIKVAECDGEGVGLFRTEFLFMDKLSIPSEEEQFEAYKKAVQALKGGTVIIRTLDVGGDKEIPYLELEKEDNPFLGFRAIRVCLQKEDVFKPQLRALLRASAFGEIRIMVPMVTCVDEVRSVKKLVKKYMLELDSESISYNKDIKIGVMIETPAAVSIADLLAKESDFFSIGTNDLTQYTMAVDRGNAKVAYLYSAYNPAVIRFIKHVIACGKKASIPVGMCGESAADKALIPLLISFGLDEFSVNPASILATRKVISEVNKEAADKLAEKVMKLETEHEIAELLNSY